MQARLIHPDGRSEIMVPANGTNFRLEELQHLVGGIIQLVYLQGQTITAKGKVLVMAEEGKLMHYPRNEVATLLAHGTRSIFPDDYITGSVLYCETEQIK